MPRKLVSRRRAEASNILRNGARRIFRAEWVFGRRAIHIIRGAVRDPAD
jgi:hypothetical protein